MTNRDPKALQDKISRAEVHLAGLDVSPEFLACENGTVNLETGEFFWNWWDAEHMLTRCCPTPSNTVTDIAMADTAGSSIAE